MIVYGLLSCTGCFRSFQWQWRLWLLCVMFSRSLVTSVILRSPTCRWKFITFICLALTLCCTLGIHSPEFTSSTLYKLCMESALSVTMESHVQSEHLFGMPLDQHLYWNIKDWHLWEGYTYFIFKLFNQLGVDRPWLFSGRGILFLLGKINNGSRLKGRRYSSVWRITSNDCNIKYLKAHP